MIDLVSALSDVDGDEDLLRELIAISQEDIPDLISRLNAANTDHDLVAVHAAAHQLKGLCGTFHPAKHAPQCERVETLCRDGYSEQLDTEVRRLILLSEQVLAALPLSTSEIL